MTLIKTHPRISDCRICGNNNAVIFSD